MVEVSVVANPLRPQAAAAVEALRRRAGALTLPRPRITWTTSAEHCHTAAREAVALGAGVVVACGGDGTIRQVAAAVADTHVELGILPVGRGNVLAHNVGLARLPKPALVDIALAGRSARLGVARTRLVDRTGAEREEVFLTLAGLGNDAMAIASMRAAGGWHEYFLAGFRRLRGPELEFVLGYDGDAAERIRAWSVFVGNQPQVPPGIELFPGAGGSRGHLVVASVQPRSVAGWARVALDRVRRAPTNSRYGYRDASSVVVCPAAPVTVHLDGDVLPGITRLSAVGGRSFLGLRCLGPGMPLG